MGAHGKSWAVIYKALVQTVCIYGCEIWVITYAMMKVLEFFRHRVARIPVGLTMRQGDGGKWEWPPFSTDLEVIGLCPMR